MTVHDLAYLRFTYECHITLQARTHTLLASSQTSDFTHNHPHTVSQNLFSTIHHGCALATHNPPQPCNARKLNPKNHTNRQSWLTLPSSRSISRRAAHACSETRCAQRSSYNKNQTHCAWDWIYILGGRRDMFNASNCHITPSHRHTHRPGAHRPTVHLWPINCRTAILFQHSACYGNIQMLHRRNLQTHTGCVKNAKDTSLINYDRRCSHANVCIFYCWKPLASQNFSPWPKVSQSWRSGLELHHTAHCLLFALLLQARIMCGVDISIILIVLPLLMLSNLFLIYWFARESPHTKSEKKCQKLIDRN